MNLESWKFDTNAQNEALINEIKGALFEYLVAKGIAGLSGPNCLCEISPDLRNRLLHYESWLRDHDLELIMFLPGVVQQVALAIKTSIPGKVTGVEVVGKLAGGSGQKELHESDLVIHAEKEGRTEDFFVGLKFCKTNSFVNTKSGGSQTFLARYFDKFAQAAQLQKEFNLEMEHAYLILGQNLYEETGLSAQGYDFEGKFGEEWTNLGAGDLPGQLSPKLNNWVMQYYQSVIQSLYRKMSFLYQSSSQAFAEALYPIMGFGARNLIQVIVFIDYKKDENKKQYSLNSFKIHSNRDLVEELTDMQMGTLQTEISSFEILLKSWRLQIRVKPMNKFTVPGLKVNCSVKFPKLS